MPDFAMCNGEGCPVRNGCLRHRAIPSEYQWFMATPEHIPPLGCGLFVRISETDRLREPR